MIEGGRRGERTGGGQKVRERRKEGDGGIARDGIEKGRKGREGDCSLTTSLTERSTEAKILPSFTTSRRFSVRFLIIFNSKVFKDMFLKISRDYYSR